MLPSSRSTVAFPRKAMETPPAPTIGSLIQSTADLYAMSTLTGTNGWASPPGDLFSIRSKNYLTKQQKSPAGDYLLCPSGMDLLKSSSKLKNVLAQSSSSVLRSAQAQGKSLKSFIFAVNLQVPGRDRYSSVFYLPQKIRYPLVHSSTDSSTETIHLEISG